MSHSDFIKKNNKDWKEIHHEIWGEKIPKTAEWTNLDDIIGILNCIGKYGNSNHMFFPNGGGMDLEGAKRSHETGCIELNTGLTYIIKPKSITFEFIDDDFEWNYFRLKTATLAPTGIYPDISIDTNYDEQITEISPLEYVDGNAWEAQEYNNKPLPEGARSLIRIFKGDFVIFKKTSIYNNNSSTYDARHEKLGAEGFKQHILDAYGSLLSKK